MQTKDHSLSRCPIARSIVRIVVTTALVFTIYALAPVAYTGAATFLRLFAVVVIVAVMIALQIRSIGSAKHPGLRAVEALVTAVLVFLALFALLYLGLADANPDSFNRPLTRVSALYFTVTILATVGFGDITAQSDVAQLLVTFQMLLDLGLIAVTVRVFSSAAHASATRKEAERETDRDGRE